MTPETTTVNTFEELDKEGKCIFALGKFYAGYTTISEYNQFCEKHNLTAKDFADASDAIDTAILAGIVPVFEDEGKLSGTTGRKFVWKGEDALFYTNGYDISEIWIQQNAVQPESIVQALDESSGFASFLEEYGFIEFESLWVGRTVKDVYAVGTDGLTRVLHKCVIAVPKPASDAEFVQNYQAITSLDGGVRFSGKVTQTFVDENSKEKYGLDADNVFLLEVPTEPRTSEPLDNDEVV